MKKIIDYFILIILFLSHLLLFGVSLYFIMNALGFSENVTFAASFNIPILPLIITLGYFYLLYNKKSIIEINKNVVSYDIYLAFIFYLLLLLLPRSFSTPDGMIIFIVLLVLGGIFSIFTYLYYKILDYINSKKKRRKK